MGLTSNFKFIFLQVGWYKDHIPNFNFLHSVEVDFFGGGSSCSCSCSSCSTWKQSQTQLSVISSSWLELSVGLGLGFDNDRDPKPNLGLTHFISTKVRSNQISDIFRHPPSQVIVTMRCFLSTITSNYKLTRWWNPSARSHWAQIREWYLKKISVYHATNRCK